MSVGLASLCTAAAAAESTSAPPTGSPIVSETVLLLRGARNEPLRGTFTVTYSAAKPPSYVPHDLKEATRGTGLLATSISVALARQASVRSDFVTDVVTVTVAPPATAGQYQGAFDVRYDDTVAHQLRVDAMFEPIPAVEPDPNSKTVTMRLVSAFGDLPMLGRPAPLPSASPAIMQPLVLVQKGEGPYRIADASVGVIQGSRGALPARTVRVSGIQSMPTSGAATLSVEASGENLEADEYNGSIFLRIDNQTGTIAVPVKVLVKNGALLPLVVLLVGLAAALLFGWWNAGNRQVYEASRVARRLEGSVASGWRLPRAEREACAAAVRAVLRAIEGDARAADIQTQVQAAETLVAQMRARTVTLLDRVGNALRQARALQNAALRDALRDELTRLEGRLDQGDFDSHEIAESAVADVERRLAAAKPPEAIAAAGRAAASVVSSALRRADSGWRRRREPLLRMAAVAIAAITYLFVLAVGWITLYVKVPTFGADPMQYLSLFLWGATIETLRGQTVTLAGLRAITENLK